MEESWPPAILASIVSNSKGLICVRDSAGRFMFVNDRTCAAFGMARESIIGKSPRDLFLGGAAEEWLANDRAVLDSGRPSTFAETMVLDAGTRHYLATKFPIFDDDGHASAVGSISLDMTAEVRMEAALRASEEKFRLAFHTLPLSVNINRLSDGTFLDINEGFTRLMGYSREEIVGRRSGDLGVWADPRDRERLVAGLKAHGVVEDLQTRFRRKDGDIRIGVMSARIMTMNDEPVILSVTRDVTEEIDLQEKYLQAQKMEAFGRLAGGVAHDFNNLLVPIIAYTGLIKETLAPADERHGMLEEIQKAATRAANLTRQILTFSRKQIMDIRPADLNGLVSDFQKMIVRMLRENIEVRVVLNTLPGTVRVDRLQIEQVLMNLAVNAADAMPDGGTLTIETSEEQVRSEDMDASAGRMPGHYAVLSVTDTGHGMDEETMKHIFEPFFTTKEKGKGTGLGLATVFGIVRQHNGHVRVSSASGRGSTFRIYLPLSAGAETPVRRAPDSPALLRGSENILVVEDDRYVSTLVCDALRTYGYSVTAAENAADALRAVEAAAAPPRMLVTDVIMPDMNGRKLHALLSRRLPGLKVLFMSGYADDVVLPPGPLERGVELLQKPFTTRELLLKVRSTLDA